MVLLCKRRSIDAGQAAENNYNALRLQKTLHHPLARIKDYPTPALIAFTNASNAFYNCPPSNSKKSQKAPEIRKRVQNSFSVKMCLKTREIQINL